MELKHRDIQTKIKHEILEQYLVKWYSIITSGLVGALYQNPRIREKFRAHFIYVDYFAYTGVYEEDGNIVYGSPIIGIQALDALRGSFHARSGGLVPRTTAILFEDHRPTFDGLVETLTDLGYGNRLKYLHKDERASDGDILLIYGDSSTYVDRVLTYMKAIDPTFSFHFIDPYGAKAVERRNVERIVSSDGADCIINMMLDPIYRFLVPAAQDDARAAEEAKAEYYDKFFGSNIWREIADELKKGTMNREVAEHRLVGAFEAILTSADKELGVKQIRLQFPERDQTYYHLFLTTHDPNGASEMNEILEDANIRQYDYREEHRRMREHAEQVSFGFLEDLPDVKRPQPQEVDIDFLANRIYEICKGQTLTYFELLKVLINSPYFKADIRAALVKLRDQKRASFKGVQSDITNRTSFKFE